MVTDGVSGELRGLRVSHHRRPEGLLLGRGVAVNVPDKLLEQRLSRGIVWDGRLDHRQKSAVLVVVLDQSTEDRGISAKLRGGRRANSRWHVGRDGARFINRVGFRFSLRRLAHRFDHE
ncbi:hypothetical protein J2728_001868 [Caulobacter segnis]|nr:hypothetical protein [Caulobacter segnis]